MGRRPHDEIMMTRSMPETTDASRTTVEPLKTSTTSTSMGIPVVVEIDGRGPRCRGGGHGGGGGGDDNQATWRTKAVG